MLTKPHAYRRMCTLNSDISYKVTDQATKGSHAGNGILRRGRVVWVCEVPTPTSAYVEGIGIITVDPRKLVDATS